MQCIVTGKKCNSYLSEEGKSLVDFNQLCQQIVDYHIGGGNPLWDQIARQLAPGDFSQIVIHDITKYKDEYTKAIWELKALAKDYIRISKFDRRQLYNYCKVLIDSKRMDESDTSRVDGLLLVAYLEDYKYSEAEEIAKRLLNSNLKHELTYCALAHYYTCTRRYELSDQILDEAKIQYPDSKKFNRYNIDNHKRKQCAYEGTSGEYLPCPKENRAEVQRVYLEFIDSLFIPLEHSLMNLGVN